MFQSLGLSDDDSAFTTEWELQVARKKVVYLEIFFFLIHLFCVDWRDELSSTMVDATSNWAGFELATACMLVPTSTTMLRALFIHVFTIWLYDHRSLLENMYHCSLFILREMFRRHHPSHKHTNTHNWTVVSVCGYVWMFSILSVCSCIWRGLYHVLCHTQSFSYE